MRGLSRELVGVFRGCGTRVVAGTCLLSGTGSRGLGRLGVSTVRMAVSNLRGIRGRHEPRGRGGSDFREVIRGLSSLFSMCPRVSVRFQIGISGSGRSRCRHVCGCLGRECKGCDVGVRPKCIASSFSTRSGNYYFRTSRIGGFILRRCSARGVPVSLCPHPVFKRYDTHRVADFIVNPRKRLCGY